MSAALVLCFTTIAIFGFCYIVGHSKISYGLRKIMFERGGVVGRLLVPLLECPACLGFWLGLIIGMIYPPHGFSRVPFALLMGCYASGSNFILGRITRLIHDVRAEDAT